MKVLVHTVTVSVVFYSCISRFAQRGKKYDVPERFSSPWLVRTRICLIQSFVLTLYHGTTTVTLSLVWLLNIVCKYTVYWTKEIHISICVKKSCFTKSLKRWKVVDFSFLNNTWSIIYRSLISYLSLIHLFFITIHHSFITHFQLTHYILQIVSGVCKTDVFQSSVF